MLKRRMTATPLSAGLVLPSRSARYSVPFTMSLPYGSLSTSGGVSAARGAPAFCTPIQRAVCTDPSWLSSEIQALLTCTFCGTPRLGTTIRLRTGSYEQLSAE